MSMNVLHSPIFHADDVNGRPLDGGLLYTYEAGTNTPEPTYMNAEGTDINTNPIVLNSRGECRLYVNPSKQYKLVLKDSSGTMIWSEDWLTSSTAGGGSSGYETYVRGVDDETEVDETEPAAGIRVFVVGLAQSIKDAISGLTESVAGLYNSLSGKANKAANATAGNLAALDANGNLTDSGKNVTDFKTKQTAVADPTAEGTGLSFIDSVSQDANGVITPHKKTVQDGTTAQKGVVQLQDSVGSTESATDKAVTPHAVRTAIDSAVSAAYKAAGTKRAAELTSSLLVAANEGNVYNITEAGTTDNNFVDGAGKTINVGDNVGVCKVSSDPDVYKFDLLSGFVDLSNYVQKSSTSGLLKNDGTVDTSDYLTKTGDASDTTSTFTKANGDTSDMSSGGKLSAIFTAISSFFASLKALAFKDTAAYSDLSLGVQSSLNKADSALQAAVEYVTTSSSWQTLETAYNAGKTLILKVENGTNWFDEYRITAVNKSSGSDRFIFCGFPTMVNLDNGSVESLEVTEWICYLDGSTTRWVNSTTVNGLELTTKGYVAQAVADKLGSNGDGSNVSVTPDGTSSGTDIGNSTTLKAWAQKFKNLVGSLKALAFKNTVGTSDIDNDAITAAKVKDNETLPVNVSGNAASANSVAWANVSGKPTNLSDFTDDITKQTYIASGTGSDKPASGAAVAQAVVNKQEFLGYGTSGQYLKSNGSSNAPSWDNTSNIVSGETRMLFGVRKSLTGGTYAALIKVTVLDSANFAYSGAIFSFTTRTQNKQNVKGIVTVSAFEYNEASTIVCRTLVLDSKVITVDSSIPQFYVRQTYDNSKWVYELWVKANADCAISVNVVNDSRNFLETMSDTSSTAPERLTECDLYSNVRAKCSSNTINSSKVGSTTIPVYVDTDGSVQPCTNVNADTVDGKHIVVGTLGSAANTIYFLDGT